MKISLDEAGTIAKFMPTLAQRLLLPDAAQSVNLAKRSLSGVDRHECPAGIKAFSPEFGDEQPRHSSAHGTTPETRPSAVAMILDADLAGDGKDVVRIAAMAVAAMFCRLGFPNTSPGHFPLVPVRLVTNPLALLPSSALVEAMRVDCPSLTILRSLHAADICFVPLDLRGQRNKTMPSTILAIPPDHAGHRRSHVDAGNSGCGTLPMLARFSSDDDLHRVSPWRGGSNAPTRDALHSAVNRQTGERMQL